MTASSPAPPTAPGDGARFREAYGAHRAAEGHGYLREDLLSLPHLRHGPLARQWSVRARTYTAFLDDVLTPLARVKDRPLRLLDLGAGNGWLSWRAARDGHDALALDLRDDAVDGLGAAAAFGDRGTLPFERVAASFDLLPLAEGTFDLAIFNASLHYALDLGAVLREARRAIDSAGTIVILDSPFYERVSDGEDMVREKHRHAPQQFGSRAAALMSLPFVEYLTRERLEAASAGLRLGWRRRRVRYPLWYELRPLTAKLRGRRVPSRFDLWVGTAA